MVSRIRVARDKAELVKSLVTSRDTTGPFQTYADAIAFAAALGAKRQKRVAITEVSKNEPGPISLEVFISRGYDLTIKLLALSETQNTKILSPYDPQTEEKRLAIFDEYANGGLEILREELRGAVDYTERLLLILNQERFQENIPEGEFDLSRFL
ncbi:MAG: DNA phosphorothioation-associated protein 4 [Spirulinaceae cyanobacterium]